MSSEVQILDRIQGGGRPLRLHRAIMTIVAGQVGVTGSGAITGGTGGIAGTYPLLLTGGILATPTSAAPASGTYTVAGGAVTAINVMSPGQYTTAPTGFNFSASGVAGASAVPSTAQVASMTYLAQSEVTSIKAGSYISTLKTFTATAFAGAPTNVYVSVGIAYQGQDYVVQTDVKAQGELTLTKVGTGIAGLRNVIGPVVVTVLVNGGGNAVSGQVEVEIHYAASNL